VDSLESISVKKGRQGKEISEELLGDCLLVTFCKLGAKPVPSFQLPTITVG
jgi:hypothetical protein